MLIFGGLYATLQPSMEDLLSPRTFCTPDPPLEIANYRKEKGVPCVIVVLRNFFNIYNITLYYTTVHTVALYLFHTDVVVPIYMCNFYNSGSRSSLLCSSNSASTNYSYKTIGI